jgi:protocatechuate 3,4-dioxygenase beta subunit
MKDLLFPILLVSFLFVHCQTPQRTARQANSLPSCEWCGAMDAPTQLNWETQIAPDDEPGERIYLTGTVYQSDGKTPAAGILIYAYHTNVRGIYEKKGDETGNGLRHGYLRGWMRTDKNGRYGIQTIMPAPYPNRPEAAHVHITLSGPDLPEYWIASTLFEGDSLISEGTIDENKGKGGFSAIVRLEKNAQGVGIGRRDIQLKGN